MRYLIYDLEFATSKDGMPKICEFGFVLTDENFNIVEKSNYLMNPNIPNKDWDWYVVKKILTRNKNEYLNSPTFDYYYEDIKRLIESADYVIGHSLRGDTKALNHELQRYNLPAINYDFYEVNRFYKCYANAKRNVSVIDMLKELSLDGEDKHHDAETDAFNEMIELKEMVNKLEVTLPELIDLCNVGPNKSYDYKVESSKRKEDGSND